MSNQPTKGISVATIAILIAATSVTSFIAWNLLALFPSFQSVTCGEHATGDCIGWSLVLLGPIYLGVYLIAIGLAFYLAASPLILFAINKARSNGKPKSFTPVGPKKLFQLLRDGKNIHDA